MSGTYCPHQYACRECQEQLDKVVRSWSAEVARLCKKLEDEKRQHAENMFRAGEIAGGLLKELGALREMMRSREPEPDARGTGRAGEAGPAAPPGAP